MGTTLEFVASSLRDLKAMPDTVQDVFGFALDLAERGMKHPSAKPMSGYTKDGVFEIAINGKNNVCNENREENLCSALLSEKICQRYSDATN